MMMRAPNLPKRPGSNPSVQKVFPDSITGYWHLCRIIAYLPRKGDYNSDLFFIPPDYTHGYEPQR